MILLQHLQIMRYCLEIYTQLVLYIGAFIFGVCVGGKKQNREFRILRYLMKRGVAEHRVTFWVSSSNTLGPSRHAALIN